MGEVGGFWLVGRVLLACWLAGPGNVFVFVLVERWGKGGEEAAGGV